MNKRKLFITNKLSFRFAQAKRNLKYFVFFILSIQLNAQTKTELLDSLFNTVYQRGQFNGNVLIAEKNKILFHRSFGIANYEINRSLDTSTIFEIASVSKQFTAMSIMILKERGKLNYDDNIKKYLPNEFPYNNVTIRHLLNHSAGLPNYTSLFEDNWDKTQVATNEDIIAALIKYHPEIYSEPGLKYKYSNTGYVLLALIVENVTGMKFDEFLRQNIFIPLEMNNSGFFIKQDLNESDNYAFDYIYSLKESKYIRSEKKQGKEYIYYLGGRLGPGRLSSNTSDLYKWDRALYTEKLVSYETLEEAFTPGVLKEDSTDYGFGWHISNDKQKGKSVFHTGSWGGNLQYIKRYIDSNKTIIILTNNHKGKYIEKIRNEADKILNNEDFSIPKLSIAEELEKIVIKSDSSFLKNKFITMYENQAEYYIKEKEIITLGNNLIEIDKNKKALEIFHTAQSVFPDSWRIYKNLANIYKLNGDIDNSNINKKKSMDLNPTNVEDKQELENLKENEL